MALADVYPLVSARALARPFTYDVPEGASRGAVVSVRLGGRRLRGVVVETGVDAPPGVEIAAAGPVVDTLPAPLVELALWLADYYGSTPARALALVAPRMAARRGPRKEPPARESLPGEAEPDELTAAQKAAVERVVTALDAGRRPRPPPRADREREDRGLSAGVRGRTRARADGDRPRPRDRADTAGPRSLPGTVR